MCDAPGRSCPVSYRYGAQALAECAAFESYHWRLMHGPAYDLPRAQRAA